MRVLAMCNGAHVRSITLARLLNKRGVECLTCGVDKDFEADTIEMMCEWAHEAIFIQGDTLKKFNQRFAAELGDGTPWVSRALAKMNLGYDVGYDDWKVPQADSLMMMMREMLDANIERFGTVIDPYGWVVQR